MIGTTRLLFLIWLNGQSGAPASVVDDFRCLRESGDGGRALEWRVFRRSSGRESRGFVRYKGSTQTIPIVLRKTIVTDRPDGRPWEYTSTWVVVAGRKVTDEFMVSTQGANVTGFVRRDAATRIENRYTQDLSAVGPTGCLW